MRVKNGEARIWCTLDVHARYTVATRGSGVEHLQVLLLPVTVLPLGLLRQHQLLFVMTSVFILKQNSYCNNLIGK